MKTIIVLLSVISMGALSSRADQAKAAKAQEVPTEKYDLDAYKVFATEDFEICFFYYTLSDWKTGKFAGTEIAYAKIVKVNGRAIKAGVELDTKVTSINGIRPEGMSLEGCHAALAKLREADETVLVVQGKFLNLPKTIRIPAVKKPKNEPASQRTSVEDTRAKN